MSYRSNKILALLAAAACAAAALPTAAQATVRYVSTTGNNANPCTLAQPCRSLQRGINRTPEGGELRILDSGNYGNNANIAKSMTISGNGNTAVLGNPITITESNAKVVLRRLVLNGEGSVAHAVDITAAAAVHIARCIIRNFTSDGIRLTAANSKLFVNRSVVRDNGGRGLFANAAGAKLAIDDSRFETNGSHGISVGGDVQAILSHVASSGNGSSGILSSGARMAVLWTTSANNRLAGFHAFGGAQMAIEFSEAHGNTDGLLITGSTTRAMLSNSTFVNNQTGVNNTSISLTFLTSLNNTVSGNTTADRIGSYEHLARR